MAAVRLRLQDAEAAATLGVCAKSGRAAAGAVRTLARPPAGRERLLLLLGVVPYFWFRTYRTRSVWLYLPAAEAVCQRLARTVRIAQTTSLASVMVIVVGAVARSAPIALGAIATALVAIGAAVAAHSQWVDARITDDDVDLERVHPAFTRTLAMRGTRLRSPA